MAALCWCWVSRRLDIVKLSIGLPPEGMDMMQYDGMGMGWGMGLVGLLILVFLVLAIAALIKYLRT